MLDELPSDIAAFESPLLVSNSLLILPLITPIKSHWFTALKLVETRTWSVKGSLSGASRLCV